MDTGEQPGTRLIDGRFELLERLGGGGMGLVWRARDIVLQREVALKEVRAADPAMVAADPTAAAELRERVLREARALARLQHPNVAVIHHIVDSAAYPHPWLVMELVTGGSLGDRLERGPLTLPEAAGIGRGVLSALRAAHAAGIMHRDVKPGNVLLRADGTPVLTDFGIAAFSDATALTAAGSLVGSPEYIAPERIRGQEGDPSSDLWSLGMLLYVAVEGTHPLRRGTALATLAAVLGEPLPAPTRAGQLGPLLVALLAKDPGARPDAEQVDRTLAQALSAPAAAPFAPGPPQDGTLRLTEPSGAAPFGATPGGGTPMGATPGGGTPFGGTPGGGTPFGGTPGGGTPMGATPGGGTPFGGTPGGGTPYGATPGGGTPYDATPFGATPGGGTPFGASPSGATPFSPSFGAPFVQPVRRRRAPVVAALCTVALVLAGTLVWGLLGYDTASAGRSGGTAATGGSGPVVAPSSVPSAGGTPSANPGGSTGSSGDSAADVNLLTPDGLRRAVAAMRPLIPGGKVFELTVYPTYAIAEVPAAANPQEYDEVDYRDGRATRTIGGPAMDEKPVNLGLYDWSVVPALLRKAQSTLNIPHPASRYLIIEADMFDYSPVIAVYFSDVNDGSGYLTADPKGTVRRTYPLGS
ncbi:serine/threonine-protein kinase [Streptacidiphilus jiangxiensis]